MLRSASFMAFIPVHDLTVARAFYETTLGLRLVEDAPPVVLSFDAGGTMLRLTAVPEANPVPFTIAGWDVPDIRESVRILEASGVAFTRYDGVEQDDLGIWTAPDGDQIAWFTDPDGNVLSLTTFAPA